MSYRNKCNRSCSINTYGVLVRIRLCMKEHSITVDSDTLEKLVQDTGEDIQVTSLTNQMYEVDLTNVPLGRLRHVHSQQVDRIE